MFGFKYYLLISIFYVWFRVSFDTLYVLYSVHQYKKKGALGERPMRTGGWNPPGTPYTLGVSEFWLNINLQNSRP